MPFGKHRHSMRQLLPIAAATLLVLSSRIRADEFPNELNSPIPEPRVLLKEHKDSSAFRTASSGVIESSDPLIRQVYETREACRRRLLSTSDHTPWQIMHGTLALRHDFVIRHQGKTVKGLDWIATGPTFRGESWFSKTPYGGQAHPYSIPYAFEGHINQFLAILSMSGLPLDSEFRTSDGVITMRDMLKNAQMTVNDKEEVTWTLWALSRYLPPDAQWKNSRGESWSIERLVRIETGKSLTGAACGGTHGLFALAHARNVRLRTGEPLRGVWLEAEYKIRRYIQTARMQQNSNGTLSSNFFRGRDYKTDFDKRMASAGHILEFLMIALPQKELSERWVRRAISATCSDLMANRNSYVSCSPLYHSVNALSIYLDRVAAAPAEVAQRKDKVRTISRPRTLPADDSAETETAKPQVPAVVADKDMQGPEVDTAPVVAGDSQPKPAVSDAAEVSESAPADSESKAETPLIADEPVDLDELAKEKVKPEDQADIAKEAMESPADEKSDDSEKPSPSKPAEQLSEPPAADSAPSKSATGDKEAAEANEPSGSEETQSPAKPSATEPVAEKEPGDTSSDDSPAAEPSLREATEPLKETPTISPVKKSSDSSAVLHIRSRDSMFPMPSDTLMLPLPAITVASANEPVLNLWRPTARERRWHSRVVKNARDVIIRAR